MDIINNTTPAAHAQSPGNSPEGAMGGNTGELVPQQVIGTEQVRKAMTTLQEYKRGKASLENRIIEDERWYKLQHWAVIRESHPDSRPAPTSAWLFNNIASKHADAMDNYPQPNVLPREQSDEQDAKILGEVLTAVLEYADFEQVYSDNWWRKLQHGGAIYSPVWDSTKENGLGDIAIRKIDPLNLYWEPGIDDIQQSRNVFSVGWEHNDTLEDQYPQLRGKLTSQGFTMAEYHKDDDVSRQDQSIVVDWYYKKRVGTRTVLHLCKFVFGVLEPLYATENEQDMAERGWYDHGQYPFVFDIMYPEEGTPYGFGLVAICRDPQMYVDKLGGNILRQTGLATNPRWFVKENGAINEDEYLDQSKPLVHVQGSVDENNLRKIDSDPVDGNSVTIMQLKIDEMKETSGNRDVNAGSTGSGVTAAAAISALQEAGNKTSRDTISGSYRAYVKIDYQVLELMRQFYDEPRYFRIVAANGAAQYIQWSNQMYTQGVDQYGNPITRQPIYDIKISAQKRSAVSREVENQRAADLYNMGFFDPNRAQEAMIALDMMEFEGKDKVLEKVLQGGTLINVLNQMNAQMQQMALLLQQAGIQVAGVAAGGQTQARSVGGGTGQSMGAAQQQAMTANSTPYANKMAQRATPDMTEGNR